MLYSHVFASFDVFFSSGEHRITECNDPYTADVHQNDQNRLASQGDVREDTGCQSGSGQGGNGFKGYFQKIRAVRLKQSYQINTHKQDEGIKQNGSQGRGNAVMRYDISPQRNLFPHFQGVFCIGIQG